MYSFKTGIFRYFKAFKTHQAADMVLLTHKISLRVAKYLERAGLISRDADNSFFTDEALTNDEMIQHQGNSVNYKISIGPQKGKKVFSLQTLPPIIEETYGQILGNVSGF